MWRVETRTYLCFRVCKSTRLKGESTPRLKKEEIQKRFLFAVHHSPVAAKLRRMSGSRTDLEFKGIKTDENLKKIDILLFFNFFYTYINHLTYIKEYFIREISKTS